MADLLAEAAAFANLLQAWRVLEKRLPAAPRRAFAGRLEDRLLDGATRWRRGRARPAPRPPACTPQARARRSPCPA